MGYWGIKAFDSDQALDTMDWVVQFDKKQIPFVTHLLLASHEEHEVMLGLLINACCENEPTQELISESSYGNEYLPWLKNVYEMYKMDKDFKEYMDYFCGGLYVARNFLLNLSVKWNDEYKQDREQYIYELCNYCF